MATTPTTRTRTAPPAHRRAVTEPATRAAVPLAVWPVAQTSPQYQRTGRYLPASTRHPGKMIPALAARIITEYSKPDQLVLDPMCGIGTTLIAAAAAGRRAIGVELEQRWATLALANTEHILTPEQCLYVDVRVGDATRLPFVLRDAVGQVDLICTSPPYACDAGVIDKPAWESGASLCDKTTLNYGSGGNLGRARGQAYLTAMADLYAACHTMLKPDGLLVIVTKNTRRGGRLFDLAGHTVALAQTAGFAYLQHVIALHAAVRDSDLVARPSFWQLTATRTARRRGQPAHYVAHEDVLVLKRQASCATAGTGAAHA